jgi:hypothetical protein
VLEGEKAVAAILPELKEKLTRKIEARFPQLSTDRSNLH